MKMDEKNWFARFLTKIIIRQKIIQGFQARTLKINQNGYMHYLLKVEEINLFYTIALFIKAGLFFFGSNLRSYLSRPDNISGLRDKARYCFYY